MLQILKVAECYESATNPRGTDFAGKQFDELVASIKEKGVLVPVLARKRESTKNDGLFEVIAGNRRLRAAKQAGLKDIPAQLVEMTDDEAREAQIVENLQRADVHPLEEGEAYRQLIEDGGRTVKDVAVKVGKSESYVRQRLFLTNLSKKVGKLYREAEIADAAVLVIGRLTARNQDVLLEEKRWSLRPGRYDAPEIKDFIEQHFSNALGNQPWLTNAEIAKLVGSCVECPPNRAALFGNIKDGQCTDLKCWTRKMKAYLAALVKENPELLMVSTRYGEPDAKNVVSRSSYEAVSKRACDYAVKAVVADGDEVGKLITVCADKACKKHRAGDRHYEPTESEKAKRKKEIAQEEARRVKFDASVATALAKVKWPLSEKHLDALFDLMFENRGTALQMPIVKRHGLKPDVIKREHYTSRDYAAPLRKLAEEGGKDGKLRMIFELLLPTYYVHGDDKEMGKQVAKL